MFIMFYYTFHRAAPEKLGLSSIEEGVQRMLSCEAFRAELVDIFKYNLAHLRFVDKSNSFPYTCPLDIHCMYCQVLAAFGYWNAQQSPTFREGVKYFADEQTDIFFITLNKSDKDFSPSTLYEDYAINERLSLPSLGDSGESAWVSNITSTTDWIQTGIRYYSGYSGFRTYIEHTYNGVHGM